MSDAALTSADHEYVPSNDAGISRARLAFIAPTIGLAFFLIQIPFARLAFDSHHDGYMLAAAIGVKEGGVIHRDVISQYGPITTLAHSLVLLLPFGSVLLLRLVTAFQLALTAALITDLGRVAPNTWSVRLSFTSSAVLAWIVLNDAWRGTAVLPWSSVTAGTLLAAAAWLIANGSSRDLAPGRLSAQTSFLLSGLCVGLSPFTRLNVGVVAVVSSLTILLVFRIRKASTSPFAGSFAVGMGVSLLSCLLALGLTNSIREFAQQAVIDPWRFSSTMVEEWKPVPWFIETFAHYAPICICIAGSIRLLNSLVAWIRLMGALALLSTALWFLSHPRPGNSRVASLLQGVFQLSDPTWIASSALNLALVASILACLVLLQKTLLRWDSLSVDLPFTVVIALSISGLIQVYPTYDSRHIWWGMPLALSLAMNMVGNKFRDRKHSALLLLFFVIPVVLGVFSSAKTTLSEPRTSFDAGSTLSGILGTNEEVNRFDERSDFVRTRAGQRTSIFLARDGDLSVLSGAFLSVDRYFVDWAPSTTSFLERLASSEGRPDVISDRGAEEIFRITSGADYFTASRAASLTHLLAPPCIAGNCPGIDPDDVCMAWGSCRPRSTPTPLELVPDTSFRPIAAWSAWGVAVNTGFSYPEDDGAWITGHHARLTFTDVADDTVRIALQPFLPPDWTHIDISVLTDTNAIPIRLNEGITIIELPIKPNTWNELVFRCDTLHRPDQVGLGEDQRLLCAKVLGFEPISSGPTP